MALHSISPIDGRYQKLTEPLRNYFSEAALIKYRLKLEVEYFIALCDLPLPQLKNISRSKQESLRQLILNFGEQDALRIKEIEKTTNHDVKAVEYYLREKFDTLGLADSKEFIHFGLTSQDVNNTAIPMMVRDAFNNQLLPQMKQLAGLLENKAIEWNNIPMLARTHGQPASPTVLGKEIYVFAERLQNQLQLLKSIPFNGKFGGATGNFNAHLIAYPEIDWISFANNFLKNKLGLQRLQTTTQIEHYDNLAALFHNFIRVNTILIDMARDIWAYVSLDYFKQKIIKGEVGSSAMPHKVNPIDFENAEGNLGIANALLEHLAVKLPISRLQRDLTDSTVTRNIGVALAHMLIAFKSIHKGFSRLSVNESKISRDLEDNWLVVAEAFQTILRREGYPNPYEKLKELSRTEKKPDAETFETFINNLQVSDKVKNELRQITPKTYTGIPFQQNDEDKYL